MCLGNFRQSCQHPLKSTEGFFSGMWKSYWCLVMSLCGFCLLNCFFKAVNELSHFFVSFIPPWFVFFLGAVIQCGGILFNKNQNQFLSSFYQKLQYSIWWRWCWCLLCGSGWQPRVSQSCMLNASVICELERVQIMQLDLYRCLVLSVLWWAVTEEFCSPHAEYIYQAQFVFVSLIGFFQWKMYLQSLKLSQTGSINGSLKRRISWHISMKQVGW